MDTVEKINAQGGVLVREIEVVIKDGASNWNNFGDKAKELIVKEKVSVVLGC